MTGHKGPTKSERPPALAEPNGCIFVSGPETEDPSLISLMVSVDVKHHVYLDGRL